jgi:hypothetical protein
MSTTKRTTSTKNTDIAEQGSVEGQALILQAHVMTGPAIAGARRYPAPTVPTIMSVFMHDPLFAYATPKGELTAKNASTIGHRSQRLFSALNGMSMSQDYYFVCVAMQQYLIGTAHVDKPISIAYRLTVRLMHGDEYGERHELVVFKNPPVDMRSAQTTEQVLKPLIVPARVFCISQGIQSDKQMDDYLDQLLHKYNEDTNNNVDLGQFLLPLAGGNNNRGGIGGRRSDGGNGNGAVQAGRKTKDDILIEIFSSTLKKQQHAVTLTSMESRIKERGKLGMGIIDDLNNELFDIFTAPKDPTPKHVNKFFFYLLAMISCINWNLIKHKELIDEKVSYVILHGHLLRLFGRYSVLRNNANMEFLMRKSFAMLLDEGKCFQLTNYWVGKKLGV